MLIQSKQKIKNQYHNLAFEDDDYPEMHQKDIPFPVLFRELVKQKIKYVLVQCRTSSGTDDLMKMSEEF